GGNWGVGGLADGVDRGEGADDGPPGLEGRGQYETWAKVLGEEYDRLRRDSALGRYTAMDPYGATNPAEFFAVATECFFEKPGVLRKRHPELYEELKSFYRQDPAGLLHALDQPQSDGVIPGAPHD